MRKILHSSLLVAGTSIGAGLLALPMTSVNIGIGLLTVTILLMLFVSCHTSMMVVRLNEICQTPASVVDIAKKYGDKLTFGMLSASFYGLSFAVLTAYFSALADTVSKNWSFNYGGVVIACGCGLFLCLCLKETVFANLNSVFVLLLVGIIASAVFTIGFSNVPSELLLATPQWREVPTFLPVIFCSFVMQMVCPHVYAYLEHDVRKVRLAIFIGLLLIVTVYLSWTVCVLTKIFEGNPEFFRQMQAHRVSVGELTKFLCKASGSDLIETLLKFLTVFGITTSAIGVAVGMMHALGTHMPKSVARLVVCFIPIVINFLCPNAFVAIFAIVGVICTVFAVFGPYRLLKTSGERITISYRICWWVGAAVVICECLHVMG
ncbi:MAG: hypothetical protein IJ793_00855 [Opitutales bacterium]|nr:hypothetical protein [Opitutales bacterium]